MSGETVTRDITYVCEDCNHGWMLSKRGSFCCRCDELGKPRGVILRAPLSPSPERSNDG